MWITFDKALAMQNPLRKPVAIITLLIIIRRITAMYQYSPNNQDEFV